MKHGHVVLASTSTSRAELLARLRIPFETGAPRFDEASAPAGLSVTAEEVRALVLDNARGKALSLREQYPDHLILGSDQLGECDGRVLNKPGTPERAVEQLRFLAGKEHRLHTAVVLVDTGSGRVDAEVVTNRLRIRDLSEERIRRYVEQESPIDCAGSYRMEGLGIALFESILGEDPTAVIGLPLIATCRLLEDFGVDPLGNGARDSGAGDSGAGDSGAISGRM